MRKANRKKLRENRVGTGERRSGGSWDVNIVFNASFGIPTLGALSICKEISAKNFWQLVLDLIAFPKREMSVKTEKK